MFKLLIFVAITMHSFAQATPENTRGVATDSKKQNRDEVDKRGLAAYDGLAVGDAIEISIATAQSAQPEFQQKERIEATGQVHVPLLGEIRVAGLSAADAQLLIKELYQDRKLYNLVNVNIYIVEYGIAHSILIRGEVERPGLYPVAGLMRLSDALALAGGTTARAGRRVVVLHQGASEHTEQSENLRGGADGFGKVMISRGDEVVVERSGVVYVTGDVNKPGGFVMDNQGRLSALQALALAEGTKSTAALDSTMLIRNTPNGRETTVIRLKQIMHNKQPDISLEPEDIVYIPQSAAKSAVHRTLDTVIQTTSGVIIYSQH
ncbi:MAG: polysaccharide biosynthesis/export family protein [Bryobacteraceae bacterium]